MGGYGSGGHNRQHVTVEACVRIDAGMLRRAGILAPHPEIVAWQWSYDNCGRHTCDVRVYAGNTDSLVLEIRTGGKEYRQLVRLSWTACHYGKRRAWLHCPHCDRRVFRLFYYDNTYNRGKQMHYFACRSCYGLTYALRRERGFGYQQSRVMKYNDKLKHDKSRLWDVPPDKPKGMHWTTYAHIMHKWMDATRKADDAFVTSIARHFGDDFLQGIDASD
jgi:hypothetical protein